MQDVITVDGTLYSVSENRTMDVNIITRLTVNDDGFMVNHEYVDYVQGCDMTEDEITEYIINSVQSRTVTINGDKNTLELRVQQGEHVHVKSISLDDLTLSDVQRISKEFLNE